MAEPEKRGHFYLVTGLIIGVLIGILVGWVISPVSYVDITPKSLHNEYKMHYLMMIAQAYQADNDMGRAYSRISQMSQPLDMNNLRQLQTMAESDPDLTDSIHALRDFINDLDQYNYSGQQPLIQNPDISVVDPAMQGAVIPNAEPTAVQAEQSFEEQQAADGNLFFVP